MIDSFVCTESNVVMTGTPGIDRQIDRYTGRQIDIQTDRQIYRQIDRYIDR